MEAKIQELTDKVFQEGVEKGEAKARELIDAAKAEADKVISDARGQAEKIISDAQKQADETKRNTDSEIKLAGEQALAALKQKIVDLITTKTVDPGVSAVLSDGETVKEFVATVIKNWREGNSGDLSLEVLLPEDKKEKLEKVFKAGVQKTLGEGVEIQFSRVVKNGFQIVEKEGGYKISLTDEDFSEFFKEYLRPKTKSYLFD